MRILATLLVSLAILFGCATMNERYTRYDKDGDVAEKGRIRSSVVGTGDISLRVRPEGTCETPRLEYTTADTGLSKEGGKTARFGIKAGVVGAGGVGAALLDSEGE